LVIPGTVLVILKVCHFLRGIAGTAARPTEKESMAGTAARPTEKCIAKGFGIAGKAKAFMR
jgi:hypothetical protein